MKRRLFLLMFAGMGVFLHAQNIREDLEADVEGLGSVTLTQDERLDAILAGDFEREEVKASTGNKSTRKGKSDRALGYRIQVFWGGDKRADQQKAQQMANRARGLCPNLNTYVEFESPHWRTRVGDFKKHEDAERYLSKLRRLDKSTMIVRSAIYLSRTEDAKNEEE